jgi:3-oxoacyl-[acyl-carrier protein] reductase
MDAKTSGRHALVCAASEGLGKACATALALEGVNVTINGTEKDKLEAVAAEIELVAGIPVNIAASDINTREGQDIALASLPKIDILVTNAVGPPTEDFRKWCRETWIAALVANILTPIMLIRRTTDGMIERKFGRIVNITSGAIKAPIPTLGNTNAAPTRLFVAGLARQVVCHNVTINNLSPGYRVIDHVLTGHYQDDIGTASRTMPHQISAGRFSEEFGRACAFLCAPSSGNITGKDLSLDGGSHAGALDRTELYPGLTVAGTNTFVP